MKKVLVTGISGFLGSHIAAEGLRRGYKIRGSVRSQAKANETIKIFTDLSLDEPELFQANLLSQDGWNLAAEGCDGIMHVASPFILELPRKEEDLIRPAVEGVRHVLEAAREVGVSRIIQTSSIASVMYGHPKGKTHFTEKDWTKPDAGNVSPYSKSKTLAEAEFWKIGRENPVFKLTSICPGLVFGPLLSRDSGTSVEILVRILQGKYPGVPRLGFACVDVRDVAALHWDAFENPVSIGKRYLAVSSSLWFREIAACLLELRPDLSSRVKDRELPDWFVRIFSLFDKPTRMILPELGFMATFTGTAPEELCFRPRTVQESIRDSVSSIFSWKIL